MIKSFFNLFITSIGVLIFAGCDNSGVVVLEKKYLTQDIKIQQVQEAVIKHEIKPELKSVKKKKINKKKQKFKKIMAPIVIEVYKELEKKYNKVKLDIENDTNHEYIEKLKIEYKAANNIQLLHALKPHPISIVLAQSAIESAWLNSRFTKEANNIFGVWSFDKNEPRIAASGLRGQKTIYLKKYSSYKEAVEDYYKSIAKSWAYTKLRYLRTVTSNPYILLPHFKSYSEKGDKYIKILEKLIKNNNFEIYDIKEVNQ